MGLGLERAGGGQRRLSATIGRLFVLSGLSGLLIYALRVTQFGVVFTSWTRPITEAIVLALPGYAAILGTFVPSAPISALLVRRRIGPRLLALVGLACAVVGVELVFVGLVAGFYTTWHAYMGPFGLDAPEWRPLIPYAVANAVDLLGMTLIGTWVAITSIQLGAAGLARAIVALGVASGVAVVAVMPYLGEFTVYERILPAVFLSAIAWLLAVGVSLLRRRVAGLQPA